MREFTEGVLEGLAYSRIVMKNAKETKASERVGRQILRILEAQAGDFEARSESTA